MSLKQIKNIYINLIQNIEDEEKLKNNFIDFIYLNENDKMDETKYNMNINIIIEKIKKEDVKKEDVKKEDVKKEDVKKEDVKRFVPGSFADKRRLK